MRPSELDSQFVGIFVDGAIDMDKPMHTEESLPVVRQPSSGIHADTTDQQRRSPFDRLTELPGKDSVMDIASPTCFNIIRIGVSFLLGFYSRICT